MTGMTRHGAALVVVVAAVACGLLLKARRYAVDAASPADAVLAGIEHRMRADGWRPEGTSRFPEGTPLTLSRFGRDGCSPGITIAVLGRNAEFMPYLRLVLGPDVQLVALPAAVGARPQLVAVSPPAESGSCAMPKLD